MTVHKFRFLYASCTMLLLAVAVGVRAWLYIDYKDLWLDESMLAFSVYGASWNDIASGMLPFMQSAPLGFLSAVKVFASIAGTHEQVLYFIPLVSGISLLFFAYILVKNNFDDMCVAIYMCFLVACYPLVAYSVEFKQYSTECLLSVLFFLMYQHFYTIFESGRIPWSVPLAFCFGMLFSSTLIFVGAGLALSILHIQMRQHNLIVFITSNWKKLCFALVFFALYYGTYLKNQNTSGMHEYWGVNFFPNMFDFDKIYIFFQTVIFQIIKNCINIFTNAELNILCGVFFFPGMYLLYKDGKKIFYPVCFTTLTLLVAFLARQYPLGYASTRGTRLILFFLPLFFIPLSYFFYKVATVVERKRAGVIATVLILLTGHVLVQNVHIARVGLDFQQTAQHVQYILQQHSSQTGVLVYVNSVPAWLYYQHRQGERVEHVALVRSEHPEQDVKIALAEMSVQGKSKAFMLFSHDLDVFYERSVDAFKTSCPGVEEFSDTGSRLFFCPSL